MLPKTRNGAEQAILDRLRYRLRDEELVREAFQEVCAQIHEMPGATEKDRVRVAEKVAKGIWRRALRDKAKHWTLTAADGSERELSDASANPEEAFIDAYDFARNIDRLGRRLNARQRQFLCLAREGLGMRQIQKALCVAQSTAYGLRGKVFQAAMALASELEPDPVPEERTPDERPSETAIATARAGTNSILGVAGPHLVLAVQVDGKPSLSERALALAAALLQHGWTALKRTAGCADAVVSRAGGILAALRTPSGAP